MCRGAVWLVVLIFLTLSQAGSFAYVTGVGRPPTLRRKLSASGDVDTKKREYCYALSACVSATNLPAPQPCCEHALAGTSSFIFFSPGAQHSAWHITGPASALWTKE